MLSTAYANYTSVNDGYDQMFGYYVTYIEKLVAAIPLDDFMFNASLITPTETFPPLGPGLQYFHCVGGSRGQNSFPCTDLSEPVNQQAAAYYPVAMTLTDSDGFYKAATDAGLSPDWIDFGDYTFELDFSAPRASRKFLYQFTGFPIKNASMVVPNPKDIVTQGLGSIPDLQRAIAATYYESMIGTWFNGSVSDGPTAYSMPVFMLMQGTDSMAQAKTLGNQELQDEQAEAKRKKDFLLLIISLVLMFVPIVGEELAAAVGLATLARIIAIAGEVGNAALATYDTVEDPKSAVVDILGMLFGVGAIAKAVRNGPGYAAVAKNKRAMPAKAMAALGPIVKSNDDVVTAIGKVCSIK